MIEVIVIIIGAGISLIVSKVVYEYYEGQITGNGLTAYLCFLLVIVAIMIYAGGPGNSEVGGTFDAAGRLLLMVFTMWPSLMVMGVLVSEYCSRNSIGAMFFPKIDNPTHNRLGRMKSLLWEENVPAALKACIEEFENYPDDFEILLDGARFLQERGSYLEALKLLQQAMDTFHANTTAWSQAAYSAASIRMEQLDDSETACMLFKKIADRMPNSEVGMRARERMHGDKPAMKRSEPEKPWYLDENTKPKQEKEWQQDADPFYRKRPERQPKPVEESDTPEIATPSLQDEMPGMFWDDDKKDREK